MTVTEIERAACTILARAPRESWQDTWDGSGRAPYVAEADRYIRAVLADPEFHDRPGRWYGDLLDSPISTYAADLYEPTRRHYWEWVWYQLVNATRLAVAITDYRRLGRPAGDQTISIGPVDVITSLAAEVAEFVDRERSNNATFRAALG
jgi:hypothetical protein